MALGNNLRFTNGVAWHQTGLRVEVVRAGGSDASRVLIVGDLNPQAHVVHVMSRLSCFRLGILIAWRALWAYNPKP